MAFVQQTLLIIIILAAVLEEHMFFGLVVRMAKSKFYAVAKGRKTGIYGTWAECQSQVHGFPGAVFKSFTLRDDAQRFLRANGFSSATTSTSSSATSKVSRGDSRYVVEHQGRKRARRMADGGAKRPATSETYNPFSSSRDVNAQLEIKVFFDGGSRGNPGLSGAGAEVTIVDNSNRASDKQGDRRFSIREFCGEKQTNNFAEYTGLVAGLKKARDIINGVNKETSAADASRLPIFNLKICGDSNLIIQQQNGSWQCKNANILPLYKKAATMVSDLRKLDPRSTVTFEHVYREQNKVADSLANEAMDARKSWTTSTDDSKNADPIKEAAVPLKKKATSKGAGELDYSDDDDRSHSSV